MWIFFCVAREPGRRFAMLPSVLNSSLRNGSSDARPSNRLAPAFDRLFDEFFTPATHPAWQGLPLATWEDENHLYLEIDAPGVTGEDIDISVHGSDLVIRGERKCERKEGCYDTRSYGRFEQRISLPMPVDMDRIEAKLTNGVLALTLPKSEAAKPRKISVKTG
jgi:HSP20 family protein